MQLVILLRCPNNDRHKYVQQDCNNNSDNDHIQPPISSFHCVFNVFGSSHELVRIIFDSLALILKFLIIIESIYLRTLDVFRHVLYVPLHQMSDLVDSLLGHRNFINISGVLVLSSEVYNNFFYVNLLDGGIVVLEIRVGHVQFST